MGGSRDYGQTPDHAYLHNFILNFPVGRSDVVAARWGLGSYPKNIADTGSKNPRQVPEWDLAYANTAGLTTLVGLPSK